MKKFEILVSTYRSKLFKNYTQVQQLKEYDHIIIDQSPEGSSEVGLNVYTLEGKGLTKSRNLALSKAKAEICLISDDDLSYVDELDKKVLSAFTENPEASVITFQIQTPDGLPYKQYKANSYTHTTRSIISTSSVEIAFKRKDIIDNEIFFDENFGVNATFPCGEEAVFLKECGNRGLKVIYIPLVVCIHPDESSGKNFAGQNYLLAKGAMIKKLYGVFGFIMLIAYIFKNLKKILKARANITELFIGFLKA